MVENTQSTHAYHSVGRRKTSSARVRLYLGKNDSFINGKTLNQSVRNSSDLHELLKPFVLSGTLDTYYFTAKVVGGGPHSQLNAVLHGIARCLAQISDEMRSTMAMNSLLTRDPRAKERKKIYHVRARKMPQFSKR